MKKIFSFLMKIHLKMLAFSEATKKSGVIAINIIFIGLPAIAIVAFGLYYMFVPFLYF